MTAFAELVHTSQRVTATRGRLGKVRELASFLRALTADEIEIAVHYLTGEIPLGRIGLGFAALSAAASRANTGADSAVGAESAESAAALSIADVEGRLGIIAATRGAGSASRRSESLADLFSKATSEERRFLFHLLAGELRQGALSGAMIDAIAAAAALPVERVRSAAMYAKSLGAVASAALRQGVEGLDRFALELFSPISPMLAQTAADVGDALELLHGEVAFEWKMDGARIQVHKSGDEVRAYTRNSNDVTAAIPEIIETVRGFTDRVLVLDGEAITFDRAGRPHPFQVTMRRFGRKLNVEAARGQLPIRAFFFDCLRSGERGLAERSTRERHEALAQSVPSELLVPRLVTRDEAAARAFYEAALAAGHEGLMAKSSDAPYEAGNRGAAWLKIKRAHTLDLVVLAAEWGHGRRAGQLSNLHLGAWDPAAGEYIMLGKTFKGLTDSMLAWQTQEFLARETHRDPGTVYVRPEIVVEIAFSDLQASIRYPGGLALRLARVKRYRPDKHGRDADSMEAVRRLYAAQAASEST